MSGQAIIVTNKPATITASGDQIGTDALDVLGFPGTRFDFVLRCNFISGSSTPTLTVTLQTSMTNDDDDNWVDLSSFQGRTDTTPVSLSVNSGVLRYVRWSAVVTGTAPVFVFEITGVAW